MGREGDITPAPRKRKAKSGMSGREGWLPRGLVHRLRGTRSLWLITPADGTGG